MRTVYFVEERNRLNQRRALLTTPDPHLALGDWLMRAHKPLGFPPGLRPGAGDFKLEVIGNKMPCDSQQLSLEGTYYFKGEVVRTFNLTSRVVSDEVTEGFCERSAGIYQSPDYRFAIFRMKEKIERYSSRELHVAYVLAQFAGRDPLHLFWKPSLAARGRSLSY